MPIGVFISHARTKAAEAMGIVDVLEAALPLWEGAIGCSSLSGYGVGLDPHAALESAQAVIAWVDGDSLQDPRIAFELGVASGLRKWIVLVTDVPRLANRLPWSIGQSTVVLRDDHSALRAMVEDVAFQLNLQPRLGPDASEAIQRVSEPPRAPATDSTRSPAAAPTPPVAQVRSAAAPARAETEYEAIAAVPPASNAPLSAPSPRALRGDPTGEFDLADADLMALAVDLRDEAGCRMAFEAGRAISSCAFHREERTDFVREIDLPFGRFVDGVGGDWGALAKLADVDVWIGAAENLLDALPHEQSGLAAWYVVGFEFATMLNLATEGVPEDAARRATFNRSWQAAAARFRRFAADCMQDDAASRIQSQLENLLGPDAGRDYTNVARSLEALRAEAARADAAR